MSSNISSKSFSYTTSSYEPKTSIYGINVKATGLAFDQEEQTERFNNLLNVRDLEEQERLRRVSETRDLYLAIQRFRISARKDASEAQETERQSRLADPVSENIRRIMANGFSASIAKDIQTPSLRLRSVAAGLVSDAKLFGQDIYSAAGEYAHRAANFFGYKQAQAVEKASQLAQTFKGQAYEQAHLLSEKATETAQNVKDQAWDKAHSLSEKALEQAQSLKGQAVEQAQILAGKASETTHLLGEKVSQQAQNLGEKAKEQAHLLGEKAVSFGAEAYNDALSYFWTRTTFSAMQETEREWRMTSGLNIERFLNALKVSDLIKATDLYNPDFEPNRWYATTILEEFERKRRFLADKTDKTALNNAKSLSHAIHLRNIKERSYRPQAKQIKLVSEVIAKKTSALAHDSPLGMAAM